MRFPLIAALLFALSATAEPLIVSPPAELGWAPGTRDSIQLASSANRVLAVWRDGRGRTAVRGRFIGTDGRPEGDRDFLVSEAIGSVVDVDDALVTRPPLALASDGDAFLAAHGQSDRTRGSWTSFTRITAAGRVEPGAETVRGIVRSMVFADGYYFVATVPDADDRDWRARIAIVDAGGHVLRENITPVNGADAVARDLLLASASTGELLIAWQPWDQKSAGAGVAKASDLFDPAFAGVRRAAHFAYMQFTSIALTEGSEGFLLAGGITSDWQILALAIIGRDNTSVRRDISSADYATIRKVVAVRYGEDFLLIADRVKVGGLVSNGSLRIASDGTPRESSFQRFNYFSPASMAVANGPSSRLYWAYIASDLAEVGLASGRLADEAWIASHSLPRQDSSTVERCGDTNIVAWRDQWWFSAILRVRRFDANGNALDPPNRALSGTAYASWRGAGLSIVCGRTNALLTWREEQNTATHADVQRGAILRRDGTLISLGLLGRGESSAAAWDGESFVVLTQGKREHARWLRWSEEGALLTVRPMPDLDDRQLVDLELAWNGTSLLAAWLEDLYAAGRTDTRLQVREFQRSFQPNAPETTIAPDLTRDWPQSLTLGARPGQWLAAWFEYRGTPDTRLRVSQLNGAPHIVAMDHVIPLQLSWNGSEWELLTEHGFATLDANGYGISYRRFPQSESLHAMTTSGERRMYTFARFVTGEPSRIYADYVREDQLGSERRRSARH